MSLNVYLHAVRKTIVFECNITHNLNRMADAAGLYRAIWRPDEIGIKNAGELVSILEEGLEKLKRDPEEYRAMNPSNGWGTYELLVTCVTEYLEACKSHPDAEVSVSR